MTGVIDRIGASHLVRSCLAQMYGGSGRLLLSVVGPRAQRVSDAVVISFIRCSGKGTISTVCCRRSATWLFSLVNLNNRSLPWQFVSCKMYPKTSSNTESSKHKHLLSGQRKRSIKVWSRKSVNSTMSTRLSRLVSCSLQ